ncbi:MAG: hypothetical protein ACREMK_12360 [Gemmatimonadota bacterium]
MDEIWRCRECGNLNHGTDTHCLDCSSEEWAGAEAKVPVGRRYSLNKEEWDTLQLSPLWTFKLVSEIDGNSDRQERKVLISMLGSAQLFGSFLLREACGALARDLESATSRQAQDTRSLEDAFCEVGRVVDNALSPSDAEEFKKDLISLGVSISRASGGGVFGGEDKMSRVEERALCFMAAVLGVEAASVGLGTRP